MGLKSTCWLLQAVERRDTVDMLRIRLGHQEFAQGDFGEAMAQFGMCSDANPVLLLNLFPSLASQQLLEPLQATVQGKPGSLSEHHTSSHHPSKK